MQTVAIVRAKRRQKCRGNRKIKMRNKRSDTLLAHSVRSVPSFVPHNLNVFGQTDNYRFWGKWRFFPVFGTFWPKRSLFGARCVTHVPWHDRAGTLGSRPSQWSVLGLSFPQRSGRMTPRRGVTLKPKPLSNSSLINPRVAQSDIHPCGPQKKFPKMPTHTHY